MARWLALPLGGLAAVLIYAALLIFGGDLAKFLLYMPWHVAFLVFFITLLRLDPSIQFVEILSYLVSGIVWFGIGVALAALAMSTHRWWGGVVFAVILGAAIITCGVITTITAMVGN